MLNVKKWQSQRFDQGDFLPKDPYLLCWWTTEVCLWDHFYFCFLVSWTWRGRCIPSNDAWCSMISRWINRVSPCFSHFGAVKMGENLSTSEQGRNSCSPQRHSLGHHRGGGGVETRFSHWMSGGSWIAGPQNHSSSRSVLRKTNGLFVPQLWETLAVFVQKCW